MKICSKCKTEKSVTDFHTADSKRGSRRAECKLCWCQASKKWRLENPEKCSAASKKWRLKNPEKCSAANKKWNLKNPELRSAACKKWRLKSPEKCQSYSDKHRYGVMAPEARVLIQQIKADREFIRSLK